MPQLSKNVTNFSKNYQDQIHLWNELENKVLNRRMKNAELCDSTKRVIIFLLLSESWDNKW